MRLGVPIHEAVGLAPDDAVTLAGRPLELAAVKYPDRPALIGDRAGLLERPGRDGDGRPLGAKHRREKFVGELEGVALHGVVADEEPAREPGADRMRGVTRSGLPEHRHAGLAVLEHPGPKRIRAPDLLDELVGREPEAVTFDLRHD